MATTRLGLRKSSSSLQFLNTWKNAAGLTAFPDFWFTSLSAVIRKSINTGEADLGKVRENMTADSLSSKWTYIYTVKELYTVHIIIVRYYLFQKIRKNCPNK